MFRWATLNNSRAAAVTSTTKSASSRVVRPSKVGGHWITPLQQPQRWGCREANAIAATPNGNPLTRCESGKSTVSWLDTSSTPATSRNGSDVGYTISEVVNKRIPGANNRVGARHKGSDVVATVCGLSRVTGVSEAVGDSDSNRSRRNFEVDGNSGCLVPEPTTPLSVKVRALRRGHINHLIR